MLRNHEKEALASLYLLSFGAVLCLDRLYESGIREVCIGLLGVFVAFFSVIGVFVWAVMVVRKMFRLLRKFVNDDDIPKLSGS